MKKYFYFLSFLLIFIFTPNVYAYDFDVSNQITSPVSPSGPGTYTATELNGSTNSWNINTRYSGLLTGIRYNIPAPNNSEGSNCFNINDTYTITMNMATNDWRNRFGSVSVKPYSNYSINWSNGHVSFISKQKISFTFTIPSSVNECYQSVIVNLNSTDINTPFTGDSNWNLKSVILTDPMYNSGGGGSSGGGSSGGGSSGGTTTPDYSDITSNQNKNTENIINNDNQNTQNVIENNNQNTQDMIENNNQNTQIINDSISASSISEINTQRFNISSQCTNSYDFDIFKGKRLLTNGTLIDDPASFYVPYKIAIGSGVTSIHINNPLNSVSGYVFILFDSSNNILSVTNTATRSISVPSNATFFQFSSPVANTFIFKNSNCVLKSQKQTDDIINNQNTNTDKEINSQKVCKNYDYTFGVISKKVLTGSGAIGSDNNGTISDYISISPQSTITPSSSSINFGYYCFYTSSKTLISCSSNNTISINSSLNIPANAYYVRFTFNTNYQRPSFNVCIPGNQAMTNTLTDGNIDSDVGNDFFDSFTNNMHGLSSIITIPLSSIQALTSSSCTPLHFPIPFTDNKYLDVPCMTEIYEQYVPTLLILIQTCWYGILAYKVLVNIFGIVKGFKDPDSDKIEVMDL